MVTLNDIEIKEITENIFKSLIKKKETRKATRNSSTGLDIMNFNWYSRTKKLKEKEIENLIQYENAITNISKCHRLVEVYNGMISNVNRQNYFANLQWYKNFKKFRQEYLYDFSKLDKLNNEYVLRQLVVDKEFLENYNLILKDRGLKVVLAKESRLFSKDIKDNKYKKYINQLMPFVTTLNEETKRKDVTTLKIKKGAVIQVNDEFLEKLFKASTQEEIRRTNEELLKILESNSQEEIEKSNNSDEVDFNKYNILINLYDLNDILLFGEFDNYNNISNPSRREQDKIKKILSKKNLMSLIDNSIVIDNKEEKIKFEIDENRLIISTDFKEEMQNYFIDVKKSEERDYINRIAKIINSTNLENIYNFLEEEINVNFTNKIYDLGIPEKVLINEEDKTFVDKHFVYFSVNRNLKTKYLFTSKVELVFLKNIVDEQTADEKNNREFYQINVLYKKIQDFFYNHNSLFPLNTIDFIISFLHFSFISYHILRLKEKGLENTDIKLKEEISKLKTILKPNEFNIFLRLMEIITSFMQEYDSEKNIENINFKRRITFYKNKKNKNSLNKRENIDFKELFLNVINLQDKFFELFDENFFKFENVDNIATTLEEYSRENNKISNFIYKFFLVFTIDTYTRYPNTKALDYINSDEDYFSVVIDKLANLRKHIKSTDDIKADILLKLNKEDEIRNANKEFKFIINPFLDFDYSIFNKSTFNNPKNRFDVTKEINSFLKTIPNLSEKDFLFEFRKILKSNPNLRLDIIEQEKIEKLALEYLKEISLFHLKLKKKNKIPRTEIVKIKNIERNMEKLEDEVFFTEKEEVIYDTIEENFHFENIYDVCYFIYLQTLVFCNILRFSSKGDLGLHLLRRTNINDIEYEIVFTDEIKLRRILNLVEIIKIILKELGIITDKDLLDLNNEINEHFDDIKTNVIEENQIKFRDSLLNIIKNPLSPLNNYLYHNESKPNGTVVNEFKTIDLFLISTKNLDLFRFILNITKLEFSHTKDMDIADVDLALSEKDKRAKNISISLNNNYEIYKYSNVNSKKYNELKKELENQLEIDYFKNLEEFIKANKNIAFIKNFIEENKNALDKIDLNNSSFSTYFEYL